MPSVNHPYFTKVYAHHLPKVLGMALLFASTWALAGGDEQNGNRLATEKGCIACHGVDGNSPSSQWPKIAGQGAKYLVKQLTAFRDNDLEKSGRVNAQMAGFAKTLSDQDIADLAAYYSAQKGTIGQADPALVELGYHIYRGGDKARGIPSCMGCHGPTGAGNPASGYPSLAGQWADYTQTQLEAFKAETRRNDLNRMMRDIASKMHPEEIKAVANLIQGLHD